MDSVVRVSCIIQYFYKYSIVFVFCIVQPWSGAVRRGGVGHPAGGANALELRSLADAAGCSGAHS